MSANLNKNFRSIKVKITRLLLRPLFLSLGLFFLFVSFSAIVAFDQQKQSINDKYRSEFIDFHQAICVSQGELIPLYSSSLKAPQLKTILTHTVENFSTIVSGRFINSKDSTLIFHKKQNSNTTAPDKFNASNNWYNNTTTSHHHTNQSDSNSIFISCPLAADSLHSGWLIYETKYNPNSLNIITEHSANESKLTYTLVIAFILLLLLSISSYSFSLFKAQRFSKPIQRLTDAVKTMSQGNYDFEINISSNDEIGELSKHFNDLRNTLHEYTTHLGDVVQQKTLALEESLESIKSILDNVEQGFLYFENDMIIGPNYSQKCLDFFSEDIAYEPIHEVLFEGNMEEQEEFIEKVQIIFDAPSPFKKELLLSLLSFDRQINDHNLRLDFKWGSLQDKDICIVIIRDITKEVTIKEKADEEKSLLKTIISFIRDKSLFNDSINEFNYFFDKEATEILNQPKSLAERVDEIFIRIHTLKGIFSQLEIKSLQNKLHSIEDTLFNYSKHHIDDDNKVIKELKELLDPRPLTQIVDHTIERIKKYLGNYQAFLQNGAWITEQQFAYFKLQITNRCSPQDIRTITDELKRLRNIDIKTILEHIPKYVMKLARNEDKLIHSFDITGKHILVNPEEFKRITQTITHIFRNAIYHGIEPPDERSLLNKSEYGHIDCEIDLKENNIIIIIRDDGKGLDIEKIRNKAKSLGLYKDGMNKRDIMNLIFHPGFSTFEKVETLAGRGMGLSAIKQEVDSIGGRIEVESEFNKGTEFTLYLPLPDYQTIDDISSEVILTNYIASVSQLLETHFGQKVASSQSEFQSFENFVDTNNTLCVLQLNGPYKFDLGLEMTPTLLQKYRELWPYLDPLDSLTDSHILFEFLNTSVGEVLQRFEYDDLVFNIIDTFTIKGPSKLFKTQTHGTQTTVSTNLGDLKLYVIKYLN